MLSPSRLESLLAALPRAELAVVGDFCLDVYWFLDLSASELSLETGQPTHPVREQRYSLGGAGNVVANLRALGVGRIRAFGAVGDDPFGERLLRLLRDAGTDVDGMVLGPAPAWQTLAYGKPYDGDTELSRLDMGNFNALPDVTARDILSRLEQALPRLDVVIVNQQVRTGIHTPLFRRELRSLMQRHPQTVFVFDSRHFTDAYPEAWLKVNAHEALRLCGGTRAHDERVLREEAMAAARTLCQRSGRPVFVTRGDRGSLVCTADGVCEIPGLEILGATDPVGAGDSFLAGAAATVAAGGTPAEAAQVGNFVAGVTVTKLKQTGTASPAEIRAIGCEPRYVHEPELAEDPRRAQYWESTAIEVVGELPRPLSVTHAIFDHDGTISALRQGWEAVMEPMMIRAILGDHYATADEALYHRVVDRVRTFIDQTTGVQTLVQMEGLVAMVREFGRVPAANVLDAPGYKAIYNEALMRGVRERIGRLQRGELAVSDFCIKNAVEWLRVLHRGGVRLYLASGTDTADVLAEARSLGYADLFGERIYGAVGDVHQEAKRQVLDRILQEIGDSRGQVVTFGDGPVEIRETRRRGALAVGVASDEVRRFGLNPAKRVRLVRAGALVVIPDFTPLPDLVRLLGIRTE